MVYKVDRLTRSLADFAKLVELFDAHGVSFVSVTQQFNTTTSMGRLTLNVLLSFAQFEREVTGERIRDKIAASKRKGMWMGGFAPIGYLPHERTLVIDEPQAERVREIFGCTWNWGACGGSRTSWIAGAGRHRSAKGSGRAAAGRSPAGTCTGCWPTRSTSGGSRTRASLYPGQHPAIIDAATCGMRCRSSSSQRRNGHSDRIDAADAEPAGGAAVRRSGAASARRRMRRRAAALPVLHRGRRGR